MKKALFLLLVPIIAISCKNITGDSYPGSQELDLTWEFEGNNISSGYYNSVFTLMNNSEYTFGESGWAFYFNQMGSSLPHFSETAQINVDHINGDLFRLTPDVGFKLEPGERITIRLKKSGQLIKKVEAPLGPYFVFSDSAGNEEEVVAAGNYSIEPFPSLEAIYPSEAAIPLPSSGWIFDQNQHQKIIESASVNRVIPSPEEISYSSEKAKLGKGVMIHFQEELRDEAGYLAGMLEQVMGSAPSVMVSDIGGSNIILLKVETSGGEGSREAYRLTANQNDGINITGGGNAGVFYGIQSLMALLPVEVWKDPQESIELDAVNITDSPAFDYRGMHLDIARNFIEPAHIRKLIKAMAYYKLNKLHLHLTEDEAWRLEIPGLPELTEVGGSRGHTTNNKDHLQPAYGSGPVVDSETGFGSGFLTRKEFIDLLIFASEHHIEVIPEVNFPGHSRAAIYAMEARYERLLKEGKTEEALKYRLIDPDDESEYISAQNYYDNVVCVCKEAPYLFYEKVVDELMAMYIDAGLSLRILHAGGDEVPYGSWEGSPICRAFLEENPQIGEAIHLQAYLEGRLLEILERKGLTMAGWEEIAMKKDESGKWAPNAEFVGRQMLPYVWNSRGDYLDLGNRIANAGYPVILCNVSNFYFDLAYNHHPDEPGHYWGGYTNTRTAFEFAPFNVFRSTITDKYRIPYNPETRFAGMEKLKPEANKNIIGIQGTLWSETIKGGKMLEYYYLPRMIALAERAWKGEDSWAEIEDLEERKLALNTAWNEFANVIGQREMPRLDYMFGGFNYRLPPPGARLVDGKLFANVDFPGLTIRYTTDGSEPQVQSQIYRGPAEVSGKISLRSFDTRGRGGRISVVE